MKLFSAVPALILLASPVLAADLVIEQPAVVPDPVASNGFYLQILGGAATGDVEDDDHGQVGTIDLYPGYAIAAALGYTIADGFSVELDLSHSERDWDENFMFEGAASDTNLMADAKYTLDLSDTIALYGALGLGYIWHTRSYGGEDDQFGGWGYQLIAGAQLDLTDNIALVGEYRFQDSFSPLENEDDADWTNKLPTSYVLAGLKLSF